MLTPVALLLAIFIQVVTVAIALNLIRITKGRLSWILLSTGFLFMAIRRLIEILPYVSEEISQKLGYLDNWLGIITSVLILSGVILIGDIFRSLKKAEKIQQEAERKILNAIIETEEKDKERFAKDLHDGLGTLLSSINIYVSMLKSSDLDNGERNNIIEYTIGLIDEAIHNTKEIAGNLKPNIITRFGLIPAMRAHCNMINNTGLLTITFNPQSDIGPGNEDLEVALFRIIKELINNTLRHASADKIEIDLKCDQDMVSLDFRDNGIGFNVEQALGTKTHKGMGLSNIISRVKAVNGTYEISSEKGKGTRVEITIGIG